MCEVKIKLDPLDILFSQYIRTKAGWKCERCLRRFKPPTASLQCSHFHGRRKKSTRWDPENCAALCFTCHRIFTEQPLVHVLWFKKRLGENRFNALTIRSNTMGMPDKKLIKIWIVEELKKIVSNPRIKHSVG